ncbi:MAG: L-rhamnose mutarotase [Tannerellaceae bacterium]|nr:L-rhamnose mutarotase [Tannerellaceae bacterium]
MIMKEQGYTQQTYNVSVKRYCQTLELKDNPELIQEYIKRHSELEHWPEIREGIRAVGILEMEIYQLGTKLFMIVETPLDFEWESAFAQLATYPRQAEWEEYMSLFQEADPGATSSEKWQLMDRIFHLYK